MAQVEADPGHPARPDASGSAATRRADARRNRTRLLQIAGDQVSRHGVPPSMTELARLADVGVGTAYRHFPTQAALLGELGLDGMRQVVTIARRAADMPDAAAAFEAVVGEVLRAQLADPGIAAILDTPEECLSAGPLSEDLAAAVTTLIGRAREAGAVRADVDAADVRRLLVGAAHALRPVAHDQDAVARHLRLVLDALRPRP